MSDIQDDTDLDNELHAMFYRAMLEWRNQGRSEEQIHGVNNFNTGVGVRLRKELAALVARREALATEHYQIKLEAVAMRHYQGSKWEPQVGDWYTIDRNDLEFFEIVDEDEDFFYFEPRTPGHSGRSKADKVGFTDKDFGVHRCKIMDYRKAALTTEAKGPDHES